MTINIDTLAGEIGLNGIVPESILTPALLEVEKALEQHPSNTVELARICHRVDLAIIPIMATISTQKDRKKIEKAINATRKRISALITKHRSWKRMDWTNTETNASNVKLVMSERFGIPILTPPKYSTEWESIRQKIAGIKEQDFKDTKTYTAITLFGSCKEALLAAFGEEYELGSILGKREKRYQWRTREEAISNVRAELTKRLLLPTSPPPRNSQEWQDARLRICSVQAECMRIEFGLTRVATFFPSPISAVIEIFDEDYDVGQVLKATIAGPARFKWGTVKEAVANIKIELSKRLNLPENTPAKNSPEWRASREKILGIQASDLHNYGLGAAMNRGSYIDLLIAAFDKEYSVKDELERRKRIFNWTTPEQAIANIRTAFQETYQIPKSAPSAYTEEWYKIRDLIVSCDQATFIKLHLEKAFAATRQYSYTALLIKAFPEYELTQTSFGTFQKSLAKLQEPATENEIEILDRYFGTENEKERESATDRLYKYISKIPVKHLSDIIETDEQFQQSFLKLIEYLNENRNTYKRYRLEKVWKMINAYILEKAKYSYSIEQLKADWTGMTASTQGFPIEAYSMIEEMGIRTKEELDAIFSQNDHGRQDWDLLEDLMAPYYSFEDSGESNKRTSIF